MRRSSIFYAIISPSFSKLFAMNKKSILIFIGTLLLVLNAFSNSDNTREPDSDRSENPVSAEGLILTDESPLVSPSETNTKV